MRSSVGLAVALCAFATPLAAQEADWDLSTAPAQELTLASLEFEGGALAAVQCQAGELNLILGGVPSSGAKTRSVLVTRADGQSRRMDLHAIEGSDLLRSSSARDVRFVGVGGDTTVASTEDEPRAFRMALDLPRHSANVNNVLTACGRALEDDRDALPDAEDLLTRLPSLEIASLPRFHPRIQLEISCIVSQGALTACRSDHESPSEPDVGARTARTANGVRLSLSDPAAAEGRVLDVVLTGTQIRRAGRSGR